MFVFLSDYGIGGVCLFRGLGDVYERLVGGRFLVMVVGMSITNLAMYPTCRVMVLTSEITGIEIEIEIIKGKTGIGVKVTPEGLLQLKLPVIHI